MVILSYFSVYYIDCTHVCIIYLELHVISHYPLRHMCMQSSA